MLRSFMAVLAVSLSVGCGKRGGDDKNESATPPLRRGQIFREPVRGLDPTDEEPVNGGEDVWLAYMTDAATAGQNYGGKRVQFTDTFMTLKQDDEPPPVWGGFGEPVTMNGHHQFRSYFCWFRKDTNLNGLKVGELVTVRGRVRGLERADTLVLEDCIVTKK